MFEGLSDRWERTSPREKRMLLLLGVTLVVCVFGVVGWQIVGGLGDMEAENQRTHDVIRQLEEHRSELAAARQKTGDPVSQIKAESEPLATYLESIEGEIGVKISNMTPEKVSPRGKFQEKSVQVTLFDLNLDQLARFLERVETKSPVVVTQRLFVKRSSSVKEKLDRVEVTVATYERPKRAGKAGAADEDEAGGGGGGGGGAAPADEEGEPR